MTIGIGGVAPVGVNPAQALSLVPGGVTSALGTSSAAGSGTDFGSLLTNAINQLSGIENSTTDLVTRAAAGENVDIHDVMIATQTESLAFNTAVQVRNKLVEAYQQVMSMQI
jgi:flagellar hook-basal body complex protein FliE